MKSASLRILVFASGICPVLTGQVLDTILSPNKTVTKRFTILDQISDPSERRDFLKLYETREPQTRRKLAADFVVAYPRSWLLPQAYEIAAKASIDLNDSVQALQYGRESLRLLPENPLLLAPLASTALEAGDPAGAETFARDAVEYLDRFDRPASVAPSEWPAIQSDLKAASYFTLGRAAIAVALKAPSPRREQKMRQAEESLLQVAALRLGDPEAAYVLGLTELFLERPKDAAFYFAKARSKPGPVSEKALGNLQRIFRLSNAAGGASFEEFLASVEQSGPPVSTLPGVKVANAPLGGYAGSEACQPCHSLIYASWRKTGMGRMFRPYRAENIIGDFHTGNVFNDETGAVIARMSIQRDQCYIAIRDTSGTWKTYPVDYTIGSKWQQAYATRRPGGDIQVFPIQYSAIRKKWINYWKIIDPPSSPRAGVSDFPNFTAATNYQTNCAPCHTSHLRLVKPNPSSGGDYAFHEGGINCEMCHGPGQDHIAAMTSGKTIRTKADIHLRSFRDMDARDSVAVCAQCHAQSAVRQPGPQGEMNYPSAEAVFPPRYASRPYAELARRAFYKDGRFRETTFIAEAFRRTACFRKGGATCGSCHQPHGEDSQSNLTSLKFAGDPDRMCLQCHSKFAANISAHTHHPASAEASHCVSCHMPRIMNSLMFKARTHRIDDIPDAGMTERFGPDESPNACLLCHADKDAQWAALRLNSW